MHVQHVDFHQCELKFKNLNKVLLKNYDIVVFENSFSFLAFYLFNSHPAVHLLYEETDRQYSFGEKIKKLCECLLYFRMTGRNSLTLPKGFSFSKNEIFGKKEDGPLQLFFLGSPVESSSRDGLYWFLREVWPYLSSKKYELNLLGENLTSWGDLHTNVSGLKFVGTNPDYSQFDFGINPIHLGSGNESLIIQSVAQSCPIISSRSSMKKIGLDYEDYFLAESPYDWIKLLDNLNLIHAKEKSLSAFCKLRELYSEENIVKKTFNLLDQFSPMRI